MPIYGVNISREHPISLRRQFLKIAGAWGTFLLLAGASQVVAEMTEPERRAALPAEFPFSRDAVLRDSSLRLQDWLRALSGGTMRAEHARGIIPVVVDLFLANHCSPVSPHELAESVLVIRSTDPALLLRDYPNVRLSQASLETLPSKLINNTGWVDDAGHIFINLPACNTIPAQDYRGYEYAGLESQPQSRPLTPAVQFASRLAHELAHRESGTRWVPLARSVADEISRAKPHVGQFQNIIPLTKGFVINYENAAYLMRLDELAADYRAAMTMLQAGLAYSLAYPTPGELYNFQAILSQAQITLQDLGRMQRTSALDEFLLRLARAAANIIFADAAEERRFAVKHFILSEYDANLAAVLPGTHPPSRTLPLESLREYFPNIHLRPFEHPDSFSPS